MASRFDRRRFRRAGLAGALAGGLALMASGVQGLAGVDGSLEAASDRSRPVVEQKKDGDCPNRGGRLSERERL